MHPGQGSLCSLCAAAGIAVGLAKGHQVTKKEKASAAALGGLGAS